MAIRDRYVTRIISVEPYTDGYIKADVKLVHQLYDNVANTVTQETELRHQDILVSYEEFAAIEADPANTTTVLKRKALYELIKTKCAAWKADETHMAYQYMQAWMPNTWPGTPEDIILR